MLEQIAWSKLTSSLCIFTLATAFVVGVLTLLGYIPADELLSPPGLAIVLIPFALCFGCSFLIKIWPLMRAARIIAERELPPAFQPQIIEAAARPWMSRMPVRFIENLKRDLSGAEERLAYVAVVEAFHRYYADSTPVSGPFDLLALEAALDELSAGRDADLQRVRNIPVRLDVLHAGEVDPEIRLIEEQIDDLRHERSKTNPEYKDTLHRLDTALRAHERDIAELRSWQATRTKSEVRTVQQSRFEEAKAIEADNERIRVWSKMAHYKAVEEKFALRRQEIDKIRQKVEHGELDEREAAFLIEQLDAALGERDDSIFA